MIARLLLLWAGVLAGAVSFRKHEHWPIAMLAPLIVILDNARDMWAAPYPPLDLALYLCNPALSAWCALRVLQEARPRFAMVIGGIVWLVPFVGALAWRPAWASASATASLISCAVQVVAFAAWWHSARHATVSSLCVVMMTATDLVSLAGPVGLGGPWGPATAQIGVVAVALIVLQGGWLGWAWTLERSRWACGSAWARWTLALRDPRLWLWRLAYGRARARRRPGPR